MAENLTLWVDSVRGVAILKAQGAGDKWSVSEVRVDLLGASMTGAGELSSGGVIDAEFDLRVDGGLAMQTFIDEWIPDLGIPALEGGPLVAHIEVSGSLDRPRYDAELEWTSPVIMNTEIESIRAQADGDMESLNFSTTVAATGIEITADGTADTNNRRVGGR